MSSVVKILERVIVDLGLKMRYNRWMTLSGKTYGIHALCYAADKYQLDNIMDLISGEIKKVELKAAEVAEMFSAEMFRKEELFEVGMEKL